MTRRKRDELERLRQAFAEVSETDQHEDHPPDPGRIWQAARGELTATEIEEMADRASRSPETAAAWRLAVEFSRGLDGQRAGSIVPIERRRPIRWAVGLAAAAVLLIGIVLPLYHSLSPDSNPTYRAIDTMEIKSELQPGTALDRDAFELRWTSTGEGSLYEIVITDADLAVVDRASFLEEPRYLVPSAALAELEDGAEVWWKIEATRADGVRVSSPTFVTTVR